MNRQIRELQTLGGIGDILSRRLVESGYSTIARIAAAEITDLERVPGMKTHRLRFIVDQARQMTGAAEKHRHTLLESCHASIRTEQPKEQPCSATHKHEGKVTSLESGQANTGRHDNTTLKRREGNSLINSLAAES